MLRRLETDIVPRVRFMGYINYKTPWIHFPRTIDEHVLYVMHDGEMFIEEDGVKYHLKKGEYLLLDPNVPHRGYEKACCDYYYLHFKHPGLSAVNPRDENRLLQESLALFQHNQSLAFANWIDAETDPADTVCYLYKHAPLLNINEYILTLGKAVDSFYRRYAHCKRSASLMLAGLLIDIARENEAAGAAKGMAASKPYEKAQSMLRFIHSNYVHKISSKDIEERFESNFDYLNRIFRKTTGYTIFNYINKVRISHSKELIETTSMGIAEIAYLVGIDDAFYFSKLFRKYSGMSPSQYSRMVDSVHTGDV